MSISHALLATKLPYDSQDLSKVQKQKAVLESSLQHAQSKYDTYVQEAVTKAEAAAAALTAAESLSADYASRLEECQQMYMDLENESDAHTYEFLLLVAS